MILPALFQNFAEQHFEAHNLHSGWSFCTGIDLHAVASSGFLSSAYHAFPPRTDHLA